MQQASTLDGVFAANRSAGRIALTVAADAGVTRRRQVYEDGPLRVRFPECGRPSARGHDRQHRRRHRRRRPTRSRYPGRRGRARSPSPPRRQRRSIARSGRPAEIAVALAVEAGARLLWLPQETILFDRARLRRRIDVDARRRRASLLMAEAVVFGRSAMGEAVEQGAFTDRWRVRRGGRLLFAETVRLDGAIARRLGGTGGGGRRRGHRHACWRCRATRRWWSARASARLSVARSASRPGTGLRWRALRQGWREPAPRSGRAWSRRFGGALPRLWLN